MIQGFLEKRMNTSFALPMKDLYHRTLVATLSIAILIVMIVFAFQLIFQFLVAGLVAASAAIAIWEYEQFAKAKGGRMILPALIALTVLIVLSFFAVADKPHLASIPFALFFISFLILFALHFGEKDGAVVNLAVSSFGLLYIAIPMGMILGIGYMSGIDGRWWIAYLITVTKITDIGAYFAGNLWGRRKLAPNISPKKTIEGAIFGLVCALVASYLFHIGSDFASTFHLGTYEWLFLGLILGAVGQFGDLSESLLKRDANKKDSNTIPGLGGMLDSIDSIIFNAPILYIYLKYTQGT